MSSFTNLRNFYEKLVIDYVRANVRGKQSNPDYLADVACVALNHLPPRYIRYEVDMIFYLSPVERKEMEDKIADAVENAVKYIAENQGRPGNGKKKTG
jgi:competence protein ComFB